MPRSASPKRKVSRQRKPPAGGRAAWFPVALFGLFAIGCVADARRRHPPTPKLRSMSFQVEGDSELYALAQYAADRWSKALGITVTATPDGNIPILLVEKLSDVCQGNSVSRGCSSIDLHGGDNWIEILSSIPSDDRFGVIMHEMGHHLRGSGEHLGESPDVLMSANRDARITRVTPADVAWVCSGPRIACSPST